MTTTDDLLRDQNMIATGVVPFNPGVADYADAEGKIILFVRDLPEGRSAFLGISLYGEVARLYEVDYAAWEETAMKMMTNVALHNMEESNE